MPIEPIKLTACKVAIDRSGRSRRFIRRHIGPDDEQISQMLSMLGVDSLDALIESTVPASIHIEEPLALPTAQSESVDSEAGCAISQVAIS